MQKFERCTEVSYIIKKRGIKTERRWRTIIIYKSSISLSEKINFSFHHLFFYPFMDFSRVSSDSIDREMVQYRDEMQSSDTCQYNTHCL